MFPRPLLVLSILALRVLSIPFLVGFTEFSEICVETGSQEWQGQKSECRVAATESDDAAKHCLLSGCLVVFHPQTRDLDLSTCFLIKQLLDAGFLEEDSSPG